MQSAVCAYGISQIEGACRPGKNYQKGYMSSLNPASSVEASLSVIKPCGRRGSHALSILIADERLIKAGPRQVSILEDHARDHSVVELGVLQICSGKVYSVDYCVCEVCSCKRP